MFLLWVSWYSAGRQSSECWPNLTCCHPKALNVGKTLAAIKNDIFVGMCLFWKKLIGYGNICEGFPFFKIHVLQVGNLHSGFCLPLALVHSSESVLSLNIKIICLKGKGEEVYCNVGGVSIQDDAYSPGSSQYISRGADKGNLLRNQDIL